MERYGLHKNDHIMRIGSMNVVALAIAELPQVNINLFSNHMLGFKGRMVRNQRHCKRLKDKPVL